MILHEEAELHHRRALLLAAKKGDPIAKFCLMRLYGIVRWETKEGKVIGET